MPACKVGFFIGYGFHEINDNQSLEYGVNLYFSTKNLKDGFKDFFMSNENIILRIIEALQEFI